MKKNFVVLFSVVMLLFVLSGVARAQSDNPNQKSGDRKLKILKKPMPESGQCTQPTGLTMIRVTFDKSAKVTDAVITKSWGCDFFDNNSLDAARRIKFEPQIKDGAPITVVKPVEYKYYRY